MERGRLEGPSNSHLPYRVPVLERTVPSQEVLFPSQTMLPAIAFILHSEQAAEMKRKSPHSSQRKKRQREKNPLKTGRGSRILHPG